MIFTTVGRMWTFAWRNVVRNAWLSLMTIVMLMLTLSSAHLLLGLRTVALQAVQFVENRVEVSVHFEPSIPSERLASATAYLRSLPQVRDVEVVTADEAFERFKARHASDSEVLASLDEAGDDLFGPELILKVRTTDDFPVLVDALANPQYDEFIAERDFTDYQGVVEQIRSTVSRMEWIGGVIALTFFAAMLVMVFHLVRVGTYLYRDEISIMRLVGATNAFVKGPFVLEVCFMSVLAVLGVSLLTFIGAQALEPWMARLFGGPTISLTESYLAILPQLFLIEVVSLWILTSLASLMAMRSAASR